jgi:protein-S-isoprenylcysteine O-methyltransferase Ste14
MGVARGRALLDLVMLGALSTWRRCDAEASMKPSTVLAAVFVVLVALLHLLRIVFGFDITVGSVAVPRWASGVAVLVLSAIAVGLWREHRDAFRP